MIKTVVLDYGHGGINNEGEYTTAPAKMYTFSNGEIAYEGELNRLIGGHLFAYLRSIRSLKIIETVKQDDFTDISLQQRVRITNKYDRRDTIFISVHCNAGKGDGFEIFTTPGNTTSDVLAEDIANAVEGLYDETNMKLRYDLSDGDKDKEANFFVIKNTHCPAVLLECGFFDNWSNYLNLKDPKFQAELAYSIYEGILNFIERE